MNKPHPLLRTLYETDDAVLARSTPIIWGATPEGKFRITPLGLINTALKLAGSSVKVTVTEEQQG